MVLLQDLLPLLVEPSRGQGGRLSSAWGLSGEGEEAHLAASYCMDHSVHSITSYHTVVFQYRTPRISVFHFFATIRVYCTRTVQN